jgi:5-bromo-4-chloroindolyl phosphate hydrolysis protein
MKLRNKILLILILSPILAFIIINAIFMLSFAIAFLMGLLLAGAALYYYVSRRIKSRFAKESRVDKKIYETVIVDGTGRTRKEINEIVQKGNKKIDELFKISKTIENRDISEKIRSICKTARKIYEAIEKNPSDIRTAREFILYYLDTASDIIHRYQRLSMNRDYIDDADITIEKAEQVIELIEEAFKKQLKKMYNNDVLDLDVEMKVLKQALQAEGL